MMYLDINLDQKVNFKMTKESFNSVINSLTDEPKGKPVRLGLLVRSTTTNLVAKFEDSILLKSDIKEVPNQKGYFRLIHVIRDLVMGKLNIESDVLMKTILMPIGVIEEETEYIIYFNLIIPDDILNTLNTDVFFVPITECLFNGLDSLSQIIKPTVSVVK